MTSICKRKTAGLLACRSHDTLCLQNYEQTQAPEGVVVVVVIVLMLCINNTMYIACPKFRLLIA